MSSNSAAPDPTPSNSAPIMLLPEHVDGYIDMPTLVDIHRFLSQSELNDDLVLAAWVKENYLYEPIVEEGRNIRTTEGFTKLDRAFRRVRSLTNKAQDKWPFFDRRWKPMSSTTVRNNSRGESAPGIKLPGVTAKEREVSADNEQAAHKNKLSSPPAQAAPLSNKQSTRHQVRFQLHQQSSINAMPITPVSPVSKSQALGEHQPGPFNQLSYSLDMNLEEEKANILTTYGHKLSEDAGVTLSAVKDTNGTTPESPLHLKIKAMPAAMHDSEDKPSDFNETTASAEVVDNQEPLEEDLLPDTGRGKVRGVHGRFLGKEKVTIASTDSSPRTKKVKSGRWPKKTVSQQDTMTAKADDVHDGPMFDVKTAEVSTQDVEPCDDKDSNDTIKVVQKPTLLKLKLSKGLEKLGSRDNGEISGGSPVGSASSGSSLTFKLAAESDPVMSNLDRLPPNCLRRKRKLEVRPTPLPRKRSRPSSSEPAKSQSAQDATNAGVDKELRTPDADTTVVEDIPQMVTRRAQRRSAVVEVENFPPANLAGKQTYTNTKRKSAKKRDVEMLDVNLENASAAHQTKSSTPIANDAPSAIVEEGTAPPTPESEAELTAPPKESTSQASDADIPMLGLGQKKAHSKRSKVKYEERTTRTSAKASDKTMTDGDKTLPVVKPDPGPSPTLKLVNGIHSTDNPSKLEVFARIHTATGSVEIPVTAVNMQGEMELIRKYADWVETEKEGRSCTSFDTFKSILKLRGV